jgi:[FeFe] hydrogenase H-cluster maturation GTPase HydF
MKNSFEHNKESRPQISIVGRLNVGKSSLLNKLIEQDFSHVSDKPGTTTSPLETEYELLPHGPVLLVDTAGIEEEGELGEKKLSHTVKILAKSDIVIVVLDARTPLHPKEIELFAVIDKLDVNCIVAVNKIEFGTNQNLLNELKELRVTHFEISCKENVGIDDLRRKIIRSLPKSKEHYLFKDIVEKGNNIVLVVPEIRHIPKSKLLSNYIQFATEILEKEAMITFCREDELLQNIINSKYQPDLIVADSDIIKKIINCIPDETKITTFSLLMSRYKSDLKIYLRGLKNLEKLQNGDKVIISELCFNHPIEEEIVGDKIPALVEHYLNKKLNFIKVTGDNLPEYLPDVKLIIHCIGCSKTRDLIRHKLNEAKLLDIPIVNYSILIAYLKGILPRVISPFSEALSEWKKIYSIAERDWKRVN